tara:strand:+ start:1442 stop:1843 length:402 start_codon:yes stop_codon:yes gene_type:complete
MILYIFSWTIIYLILISIVHYLFLFFQKNLTTTKSKDFYNSPNKEYSKINDILSNDVDKVQTNSVSEKENIIPDYESGSKLPNHDVNGTTESKNTNDFNIDSFNTQFENKEGDTHGKNNMKGELQHFLNEINN